MKKLINIQIIILIFISFFLFSCKKENSQPTSSSEPATIKGKVIDIETGLGIAGVPVNTDPFIALIQTDNGGNYSFDNVKPGNYVLSVSKTGYVTQTRTINAKGGEKIIADFSLAPTPLNPGQARFDAIVDGISWSNYTTSGSCSKNQDTIIILSSFSLGSNSYRVKISIVGVSNQGSINLGPTTNSYITYTRTLYGYSENYSTKGTGGSGQIVITSFNANNKSIKGTFTATVTDGSSSKGISNGTFSGVW